MMTLDDNTCFGRERGESTHIRSSAAYMYASLVNFVDVPSGSLRLCSSYEKEQPEHVPVLAHRVPSGHCTYCLDPQAALLVTHIRQLDRQPSP